MNKKSNTIILIIAIIAFCFSVVTFLHVKTAKKDILTAISEQSAQWEAAMATKTEHPANSDNADNLANSTQTEDIQYVLYLGTNDKDTNIPVFSPEESRKKAEEILVRFLGGFTISEAQGGWKDEGVIYREYTLIIYLSDTTLQKIHEVCDELIKTFNQSSVLIQANKTQTEFYSGI